MAESARSILEPGRNCWRVDRADKFVSIQDAADYFKLVRHTMLAAKHNVFILGWDILASVDLMPGESPTDGPTHFGSLVDFIAKRNPELQVNILIWNYSLLYTLERDPFSRVRLGWTTPGNVRFAFDNKHPVGGSHHQKVVVIDDQLAFCGGIDLTGHRWDTSAHNVDEPHRKSGNEHYCPYHEVQAMLSGPAAASLGELARYRWRAIGEEKIPAIAPPGEDLWPAGFEPDFTNAKVGIVRTMPAIDTAPETRECEALFVDSITNAKHLIYVESQYFTNADLARALVARLQEPSGPEVIVVSPEKCEGWLEHSTMGAMRERAFRMLVASDAHGRLRIVCPMASRSQNVATFVHSKVTVVDDIHLRIGSANFSRRSMGVDTECDVVVDGADDPVAQEGIRRAFHRLLGEHLGISGDEVTRGIASAGSLREFLDSRAEADRTLVRIHIDPAEEGVPEIVQQVADPDEPFAGVRHRDGAEFG